MIEAASTSTMFYAETPNQLLCRKLEKSIKVDDEDINNSISHPVISYVSGRAMHNHLENFSFNCKGKIDLRKFSVDTYLIEDKMYALDYSACRFPMTVLKSPTKEIVYVA